MSEIKREIVKAKNEKGEIQELGPFEVAYVEYRDAHGARTVTRLKSPSRRDGINVGVDLMIAYDPRFPGQVEEAEFIRSHGFEILLSLVAGLFLLIAKIIGADLKHAFAIPEASLSPSDHSFDLMLSIGLLVLGLLLAGYALWSIAYQANPANHGSAPAKVVGFETAKVYRSGGYVDEIYPVLQFQTATGGAVTTRSHGTLNFARDWIGAEYEVTYSMKDATYVHAKKPGDSISAGAVFVLFVGLILVTVSASFLMSLGVFRFG